GNHPAATVQKTQGAAATSPQAPPAAVYVRADPAMDSETRDPGTYHSASRGPTEPRGPGPGKKPPRVSQHTPKYPAPDTKNHKYTSGQRHQPPADSIWEGPKFGVEKPDYSPTPSPLPQPFISKSSQLTHVYTQSIHPAKPFPSINL
ncbi:hypothetical protein AMECASPLE_008441, partial [Ameca splendens]